MYTNEMLDGHGLSFEIGGKTFWVRPPTPEEYDDALHLQSVVRKRILAAPEIVELRSLPASAEGQETLLGALADTEQALQEVESDNPEREMLTRRLAALRRLQETRTLADEVADERAILARDRWLTLRLLTDDAGQPVVLPTKVSKDSWAILPLQVRNGARPLIWALLRMIEELPFGWVQPPEPSSK